MPQLPLALRGSMSVFCHRIFLYRQQYLSVHCSNDDRDRHDVLHRDGNRDVDHNCDADSNLHCYGNFNLHCHRNPDRDDDCDHHGNTYFDADGNSDRDRYLYALADGDSNRDSRRLHSKRRGRLSILSGRDLQLRMFAIYRGVQSDRHLHLF